MNFIENLNTFRAAIPGKTGARWRGSRRVGWDTPSIPLTTDGRACSLMRGTDRLRMAWMRRILERVRIMDAALLNTLMLSVSFFASTAILIVGSLIAAPRRRRSRDTIDRRPRSLVAASRETWTLKLFSLIVVFIYAFFNHLVDCISSIRCAILIGASAAPRPTRRRRSTAGFGAAPRTVEHARRRGFQFGPAGLLLRTGAAGLVRPSGGVRRRLGLGRGGVVSA